MCMKGMLGIGKLNGAKVFSSLDLQSDYHQIPIAEKAVRKTAFVTYTRDFLCIV